MSAKPTDAEGVLAAMRRANVGAVNRINAEANWCAAGGFTQQAREIRSLLSKTKPGISAN